MQSLTATGIKFPHKGILDSLCAQHTIFCQTLQVNPQLSTFTSTSGYLQRVATPDTTARAAMKQMPAVLDQRRCALLANTEHQHKVSGRRSTTQQAAHTNTTPFWIQRSKAWRSAARCAAGGA